MWRPDPVYLFKILLIINQREGEKGMKSSLSPFSSPRKEEDNKGIEMEKYHGLYE